MFDPDQFEEDELLLDQIARVIAPDFASLPQEEKYAAMVKASQVMKLVRDAS